jgi:hypothetical protein
MPDAPGAALALVRVKTRKDFADHLTRLVIAALLSDADQLDFGSPQLVLLGA